MSTDVAAEVKRRFNDVKLQFDFVQSMVLKALNTSFNTPSDTKIRVNLQLLDIKLQILELDIQSLKFIESPTKDEKVEEIPPPPSPSLATKHLNLIGPPQPSHWGSGKGPLKLSVSLKKNE